MQDNPYSAMLGVIRRDAQERAKSAWVLGIVRGVKPLKIEFSGKPLEGVELLVNPLLLKHERKLDEPDVTGILNGESVAGELHSTAQHGDTLAPGDRVVMLPADDWQSFAVICKVVSA